MQFQQSIAKGFYRLIPTFFITFFVIFTLYSQKRNTIADLKAVLTLKLCEHVSWASDTNSIFTITIFSDDTELINTFKNLSATYKINRKPIAVKVINSPTSITSTQVLYVGDSKLKFMKEIWNSITHKNILLFTEKHTDAKEIMFNILPDSYKGNITFEFNRANLIFEGFDIHANIIELRGSEIDIRELYRQTKTRLEKEVSIVNEMQVKLDSQKQNILKQEELIETFSNKIDEMDATIGKQNDSITQKEAKLRELEERTKHHEQSIQSNLLVISDQKGLIKNINSLITQRNYIISTQHTKLDSLNSLIIKKESDLTERENQLAQKEMLIGLKNKLIYLMTALIFLIFTIIFLIFRAYRSNKAAQVILSKQKDELETTLKKLTQAQTQLIQAEKMASLGILTAGIAHEINNPVNFINSGIQGLTKINRNILKILKVYRDTYHGKNSNKNIDELEEKLDLSFMLESSSTMINNIKTGVDRTVSIIKSLRSFTRADEEVIKPLDIHENINLALTILYNQYKYRIDVIKQYDQIPQIMGFPGKLNQVFMNMITNAIQAIPERGNIWITTHCQNQNITISIKDNGVGIPDNIKNKIFDPFFTTKEVGKGTGMGLSIVFSIIEEHKGKIDLISELNKGTEFIITLPLIPEN